MSRDNITHVGPAGFGKIRATFHCKDGYDRTYEYSGTDAVQFAAGADPRYLNGERVEDSPYGGAIMGAVELGEALAAIAL